MYMDGEYVFAVPETLLYRAVQGGVFYRLGRRCCNLLEPEYPLGYAC